MPPPPNRYRLWVGYLNQLQPRRCAEIGVWKGRFANHILSLCPSIQQYWMVDPWKHLPNWNRPWNVSDEQFKEIRKQALAVAQKHQGKVRVLEGTTLEVADQIGELDFAYIDGDHTLRGITIDMVNIWPKIRLGGVLGGDDYVVEQASEFEPIAVCPFAKYFAEAVGASFRQLPYNQFSIRSQT